MRLALLLLVTAIAAAGPNPDSPGDNRLGLQRGPELSGLGERDLLLLAEGHVSNSVRINIQ